MKTEVSSAAVLGRDSRSVADCREACHILASEQAKTKQASAWVEKRARLSQDTETGFLSGTTKLLYFIPQYL